MWTVAPHTRLAPLGEDLVIFDLASDRYLALTAAIDPAAAVTGWLALHPEARDALLEAGYLTTGSIGAPTWLRPVVRSLTVEEVPATVGDALLLLRVMIRVGARICRGKHVQHFEDDRLSWCAPDDERRIRDTLGRLKRLRLLIPTPARCLPAALTAALFLKHHDLTVDLVFGVRGHPFDAHCWLEWNGMILDDDVDRVRVYKPIAVGRP